jgi:hypothetical protein
MKKMNKESFAYFLKLVADENLKYPKYRIGQTMFNVLHDIMPELAESISGTENDPFYDNKLIGNFFSTICEE